MNAPSVAKPTGTVYLIVAQGDCEHEGCRGAHDGGKVVAVFDTKPEAQGFCYRHEPHFYWIARTVWAWPEIVNPELPGYYAASLSDKEYDLARFPKAE